MSTTQNTAALIFTDGACIGNPGPGGYAAVIQIGDAEQVVVGNEGSTTNNRMEMMAAIRALECESACKRLPSFSVIGFQTGTTSGSFSVVGF